jgi:hypothetical protein
MSPDEQMAKAIAEAFGPVFTRECKKRCPDNDGYEPKCEYCDVQRIFHTVHTHFTIAAGKCGAFLAVRCLIENEHMHSKFPEGWVL